jgi:predicted DNA-binding transcriptional regulator AlpA
MTDGALPFTPRALRAELAALYVGVSESWWLLEVKAGRAPSPVYLSPRIPVWLREDLDAWLDDRAGRVAASPAANPWDAPPDAPRRAPPPRP